MNAFTRAQRGDRDAFYELVCERLPALERYVTYRMGTALRRSVDPQDIVQEVLIRAYRSLGNLRWQGEGAFSRWLRAIARHAIVDAARARNRRHEVQLDHIPAPIARDPSPSGIVRKREISQQLLQSLANLSPDHETVIKLAHIDGLPLREIAVRMARSKSAVKNLLWRAMRELRADARSIGSDRLFPPAGGNRNESAEPTES